MSLRTCCGGSYMKCAFTFPLSSHSPYRKPHRWMLNASAWFTYLRTHRKSMAVRRCRQCSLYRMVWHARLEYIRRLAIK
jgi:hypothetical protein